MAEGRPWAWEQTPGLAIEEHFAQGLWPVLHERHQKFPEGESLDDLYVRATKAIDTLVMPHVWKAAREGKTGVNIALASHGLCISELIPALLVKDEKGIHPGDKYRGLLNTAWTRVTVEVEVTHYFSLSHPLQISSTDQGAQEGVPLDFPNNDPPKLRIRVTDVNRHEHLDKVVGWQSLFSACIPTFVTRNARRVVLAARRTTLSKQISAHSLVAESPRLGLSQKRVEARAML